MKNSENFPKISSQKISEKSEKSQKSEKSEKSEKIWNFENFEKQWFFVKEFFEKKSRNPKNSKNFPSEKKENTFRKFSKFLKIFFDKNFTKSCAWSGSFILTNKTLRAANFIFDDFFMSKNQEKVRPGSDFGL